MSNGYILIIPFRRFQVRYIIAFFFAHTKVVAQVKPEAAGISLAETSRIYTSLVDGEVIIVGKKNIIHAGAKNELLFYQLLINTKI